MLARRSRPHGPPSVRGPSDAIGVATDPSDALRWMRQPNSQRPAGVRRVDGPSDDRPNACRSGALASSSARLARRPRLVDAASARRRARPGRLGLGGGFGGAASVGSASARPARPRPRLAPRRRPRRLASAARLGLRGVPRRRPRRAGSVGRLGGLGGWPPRLARRPRRSHPRRSFRCRAASASAALGRGLGGRLGGRARPRLGASVGLGLGGRFGLGDSAASASATRPRRPRPPRPPSALGVGLGLVEPRRRLVACLGRRDLLADLGERRGERVVDAALGLLDRVGIE